MCKRCFARRDLLLRHQQKLHATGPPAATRPRNGRRDSNGTIQPPGSARARRPSMASSAAQQATTPLMRPRANTISHIDVGALQNQSNRSPGGLHSVYSHHTSASIAAPGYSPLAMPGYHPSYTSSMPSSATLPMPTAMHTSIEQGFSNPLRIETSGLGLEIGGGLRTAPVFANHNYESFFGQTSSTINPAHLHFGSSESGPPQSPFASSFGPYSAGLETDAQFDWSNMDDNFLVNNNESVIEGSSPSAISQNSAFSDMMIDGSNQNTITAAGALWTQPNGHILVPSNFMHDPVGEAVFPELMTHMAMSPAGMTQSDLQAQADLENYMSLNSHISMSPVPGNSSRLLQSPLTFGPDTANVSRSTTYGSPQLKPANSLSTDSITDSITDSTRQALLFTLSQEFSAFGHATRTSSFSNITIPLGSPSAVHNPSRISLPSTADLKRYVQAYATYFHPHLPFLHLPTLNFDTLVFANPTSQSPSYIGGGGCLLLAMASIGANYEYEHEESKQMFIHSRTLIKVYLDSCRRRQPSMISTNSMTYRDSIKTPLWLVQAMLLTIVLGHQSGDRISAEIATTTCASLVSLAKDAELEKPSQTVDEEGRVAWTLESAVPGNEELKNSPQHQQEFMEWFRWKSAEERRRTMFAVFTMSTMLILAYNQHPRVLTSEINLSLPCEENLWAAPTAKAWRMYGGEQEAGISFQEALNQLLSTSRRTASSRRKSNHNENNSELKPSSFGCYALINGLHLVIWEAQSRFGGTDETQSAEKLRSWIEPALRDWQTAWRSNPTHILERFNPHGPLAADCVPLLDLAYIRLFVNLGRSKEALWIWDFDSMAREVANESSANKSTHIYNPCLKDWTLKDDEDTSLPNGNHDQLSLATPKDKREVSRLLRKAAFYAADSLVMSSQLSGTLTEYTSRELPIGAAMCAFDCAQILAEWIANVQDRLGPRIHAIIGRDQIDLSQSPEILELEEEDLILLAKVKEILMLAGSKIAADLNATGQDAALVLGPMDTGGCGFSLLMVTAYMLSRAPVWGVQKVMSEALRKHADKLRIRAETSIATDNHTRMKHEFVQANM